MGNPAGIPHIKPEEACVIYRKIFYIIIYNFEPYPLEEIIGRIRKVHQKTAS